MICVVLLNTLDNMVIPELGKIRDIISSKTENRPFILSGRVRNVKAHPECVQLHRVEQV